MTLELPADDLERIKRIGKSDFSALDELYKAAYPKLVAEFDSPEYAQSYLQDALIKLTEDVQTKHLRLRRNTLVEHLIDLCRERWDSVRRNLELDKKVIECLQTGDGWAFYYMQRMYFPSVTAMVRMQGGTTEDAQDVIMEGIAALLHNVKNGKYQVQDTARLKTYFLRVCRNIWIDELKRKSRSRIVRPLLELDLSDKEVPYYDVYEEENLTERQRLVESMFHRASDTCKQVLGLFYYENLSHEEIAQRMGYKNAETSKTQKLKCLTKLKLMVKRLYEGGGIQAEPEV